MKKLFLLLALVGFIFTACEGGLGDESNGGSVPSIELAEQNIEAEFEPNTYTVAVISPYSWEATTKNSWIDIKTATGVAGTKTLKFSIDRNEEEEVREGTITLKNENYNLVTELYVTQKAFDPKWEIGSEVLNFEYAGGSQEITITANFEYTYTANADWIRLEKSDIGLKVTVDKHTESAERKETIVISNEKYKFSESILVSQRGFNAILYTSSDGNVIAPNKTDAFGVNIVSNTYENGQGVIVFDAPVVQIGNYAFYNCSSLTSITIPDSVTLIGKSAFYYCSSLTSITIPDSVTSIGGSAFYGCTGELIINSKIVEEVRSIYEDYWSRGNMFTKLIIGENITKIGACAFYGFSSLTSVTIPDSVTSIGSQAFRGCKSLTSITIPDSVTSIEEEAFRNCSSLTSITIPYSVTSIGNYAFGYCSSLISITIPDSVTSIGEYAFQYCESLASVTIGNSVTEIGSYTFYNCSSLTSVTIGNSVTSIGDSAFNGCSSLTSVTLPDSVTKIGGAAFYKCSSLTSVTIPDSVTSIGDGAFEHCTSLKDIYCKPITPPTGGSDMFYNTAWGRKIYVPTESVDAYKSAEYWSKHANSIVGYDF